jgi:hypothetical protein
MRSYGLRYATIACCTPPTNSGPSSSASAAACSALSSNLFNFPAAEQCTEPRHARSAKEKIMKRLPILVLALVSSAANAAPPKEVAGMASLVGSWKGSGSIVIGKDRAKLDATYTCKPTAAQYGVLCSLAITGMPGMARYEETDLFGFEPASRTLHWFAVTNAGETHDHATPFTESNKLRFSFSGTQEGKPFKEVVDWEFGKDAKSLAVRGETFLAGSSTSVLELKLKKL